MKVTDYIAQFLKAQGVTHVYEMSGGMITRLLDSLYHVPEIKIVSVHHEQTAAFAAEAAGRITGIPGIALATSGPGATNLLTGIGSCYFDSSPAVFITGQVNRHEQKGDKPIRQLGFQETDIVSMALPITKAAWKVENPADVPDLLRRAFHLATEGRPGPVLIDIPMDVQAAEIEGPEPTPALASDDDGFVPDAASLNDLFEKLAAAEKPLILAGGGIRSALAVEEFRQFVEKMRIPVVYSLMAVDVLTYDDPLHIGMIGSYGNRWANLAIGESDFLLVLGSRLDIRQTGAKTEAFKGDRVIYHVDADAGEINNRIPGCVPIVAHLRPFLAEALAATEAKTFPERSTWLARLNALRDEWPDTAELAAASGINPNIVMHKLSAAFADAGAWVIDVGQHQMWAAQSTEITSGQRYLTSGGMGSMGFALPAAIGAAFAVGGKSVVVIAGDGGFQTNIQELQTVARNNLAVKIVVFNNHCHGMVRQFQTSYMDSRLQSTVWGYSAPDFVAVAAAYKIPSRAVATGDEMDAAIQWLATETGDGPALLEIEVDMLTDTYPKIAFGRPMTEMEPFAKPIEMEST